MGDMHLKQLALLDKTGSTYSTGVPFTKSKEGIKKITKTRNTNYIYKNDLDKDSSVWYGL